MISLNEPKFDENDKKAIKECIESGWVSSVGKNIEKFENRISNYTKSPYAIACINGTSALHISMVLSGVASNTEVITPSLTFIATINAIKYSGANPIFMDSDHSYCINVNKTIEFIKNNTIIKKINNKEICFNKKTNKIIKALIIVNVFGNATKLDELVNLCKSYNISLIEDATESLGTIYTKGKYKNKHCGTIGLFGCLSFNGNKIITSGGGGMILTKSKLLAKKARYLINQSKDDPINFIHNNIGYNYRLSNLHASLGLSQFKKIQYILNKKRFIHNLYKKLILKNINYSIMTAPDYCDSNNWLNILIIKNNKIKLKNIIKIMQKNKISVRPLWYPNHLQKPFIKYQNYKIKNTLKLLSSSICLPSSYILTVKEIHKIIKLLP